MILSWVCYAGAALCLFFTIGLLVLNRMSFSLIYGHLGIGLGVAIMLAAGGIKFGNTLTVPQLWMILAAIGVGYLIFFFGRRRARDEKRLLDAIAAAKNEQTPSS